LNEIPFLPTLGEQDIIHVIQTLPGIVTTDDYSKKLYVRGGDASQTMLLLDDIPVYNYLHIIGLFSPFHVDAIGDATLIPGNVSAKYGESTSGIFKVNTKDKIEKFSTNLDVTLINTKLFHEGSTNFVDYFVALRRSYTDVIFPIFFGFPFPVVMTDALGKVIVRFNNYNKLNILLFYSNDSFEDSNTDNAMVETEVNSKLFWGNKLLNLQWEYSKNRYLLNVKMGLNVNKMYTPVFSEFFIDNKIQNITTRIDNTFLLSDRNLISWGIDYYRYFYDYYWNYSGNQQSEYLQDNLYSSRETFIFFDYSPLHYNKSYFASFPSFYCEWVNKNSIPINFTVGLRFTPKSENYYSTIDPRLQISYNIFKNISLRGNISQHSQYITTVKDIGGFDFTLPGFLNAYDAWFPLSRPYKPIISNHISSGVQWVYKNLMQINIEGYYKTFQNVVSAIDSIPNFIQGTGHAEGLELFFERKTSKTQFNLSYTLSRTVRNIGGEVYYPSFDRRHDVDAQYSLVLPRNYNVAIHGKWSTGVPYTPLIGSTETRYYYNKYHYHIFKYIKGDRNSERFDNYLRFDLQITKKTKMFNKKSEIFLQIYNVTNEDNIFYYSDLRISGTKIKRLYSKIYYSQLPMIPSIGIKIFFN
jgi:hypothetical protein